MRLITWVWCSTGRITVLITWRIYRSQTNFRLCDDSEAFSVCRHQVWKGWWVNTKKHSLWRFFKEKQDVSANLWTMFFTDFAHSVVEDGSRAWELPAVTSITQLCGDSSSSRGRDPSSSSWLLPPPKLTAALRRFSCKQHGWAAITQPRQQVRVSPSVSVITGP